MPSNSCFAHLKQFVVRLTGACKAIESQFGELRSLGQQALKQAEKTTPLTILKQAGAHSSGPYSWIFHTHAAALGARWSTEHSESKELVIIGPMLWVVETANWLAFACPFPFGQRRPLPFNGPMGKKVLTGEQEKRQLAGASELSLGSCGRI